MKTDLPETMLALTHSQAKQQFAIERVPLPTPDFAAGEHLIKVFTVGLVGTELLWPRPPELNVTIPGVDVVGKIVSAPSSSAFQPGAIVYARTMYPRPGSSREYSIVKTDEIAIVPKTLSYIEAAAVPVSALTAWQVYFEHMGYPALSDKPSLNKSLRILVNGASGGVGQWAVQLAHLLGAYVIGVTSAANAELVKSLGADEIIDYRTVSPRAWAEEEAGRKVDLAFDLVGRAAAEPIWHTIKESGRYVTVVPPEDMNFSYNLDTPAGVDRTIKGTWFLMHPSGEDLTKIANLIDAGRCRPVVDSVYSLKDGEEAFRRVDSGRTVGKVVLKVADE
jgi:NADPH:quinone reductase-like Zn-dependent oxidoreductase